MAELDPRDYQPTPVDQASRWAAEIEAAETWRAAYLKDAEVCFAAYLNEKEEGSPAKTLPLYTSTVETKLAMLYGNTPDVAVERRYADADDDEGRVAAEIAERVLNADLERTGDNFQTAQATAGWEREVPGLGAVWLRYVVEMGKSKPVAAILDEATGLEVAPAVPEQDIKEWEDVETDWVHFKDFLYSPCRVWHERRWVARRIDMPKETFDERFAKLGEQLLASVPTRSTKESEEEKQRDPLASVEVWEIWSKRDKLQVFWVKGFPQVVESNKDPLGLDDFFPCPEPMVANPTTKKYLPRPDYVLFKDQYESINRLTSRIALLIEAVRATGVYDKASPEVRLLLDNTRDGNKLYPADSWAMFAEKGGLQGAVVFLPLADIVAALATLRECRAEEINDLFQVSGMSDIMRGQATTSGATATEQAIKSRFGSVRMQARQDKAAKFATDTQRLRFEIMCKHFDAKTILDRSNCARSYDAGLAEKGVALLKEKHANFRVAVKSESMSLTDFAALKQERMEVLTAVSAYLSTAAGIAQQMPGSTPGLVKILQATVAGLRGADAIESILDEMATQAEEAAKAAANNPQQAPPDPKVQAQMLKNQGDQMKAQLDKDKEQTKLQSDLVRKRADVEAHAMQERTQREENVREAAQKQMVSNSLKPKETPPHA